MNSIQKNSNPSGVSYSSKILEGILAPSICKFTKAEIPDIEDKHPESGHWIQNYFLNSAFTQSYKEDIRPTVMQCLRRVSAAFRYYHDARKQTLEYLSGNNPHHPKTRQYFKAVDTWEAFFLQAQIFMDAYNRIGKFTKTNLKAFQPKDGSQEQRLYDIANCIKHGSDPDNYERWKENWAPLWLVNEGFKSIDYSLTFKEAGEILEEMAKYANTMQNPSDVQKDEGN